MHYVLLITQKVASGVRGAGGVRRVQTAFIGLRALAGGNGGFIDGIRLLPFVPDKDIRALVGIAKNVPLLMYEALDLPYTGTYYDITPWLNRHGLRALYKKIDVWREKHKDIADALSFVCIGVPAEFFKMSASPWVAPTSTLKTLSSEIMGPIETIGAYWSHGQWSSREPRVIKIQRALTSIIQDVNRLLASGAAYLNQKNTVVSLLEQRRLDHFLAHPPTISTQLARDPLLRSLLKATGSTLGLLRTGLDATQGATLPQRLSKTAESIRLLQDTRLLHALLPEAFDSIAERGLSFAKNLHQTWWIRGPALGLALADVGLNAIEMQRNYSHSRDVLRHPLQKTRDVISRYFAAAPWPSESLAQRQALYQMMRGALLGSDAAPSSFEKMIQNLSFNLAVYAGREAGRRLGQSVVRPVYWLYAWFNESSAYGYYPEFAQRWPFFAGRIPRVTSDTCLQPGLLLSDPVADSALFYFLNRVILEGVVTRWGGALASGIGAGLSRNVALQVVNTEDFVLQLRETLNEVFTNFLFNPEELLAFEDLNPSLGVIPRDLRPLSLAPETLDAVTTLVDEGLSLGAAQLSKRLSKSSLSPRDLPWPERALEWFRRPFQMVALTQSYAIDQFTRGRAKSSPHRSETAATGMDDLLAQVDKALESTALATHARVELSIAEWVMWPVTQSMTYASTYFTSTESALRKRITEASTLEQLPSIEELNFLEKQAKNALSGLYVKWDAAQKIRREWAAKAYFLRDEPKLLLRVQRDAKQLFQTYLLLSKQIESARFENNLPEDRRLQGVLWQFEELLHRETQVSMSRRAMRYINLLKSVIGNDLVLKKQQKLAELKQGECLALLRQFAAFLSDNPNFDEKNTFIQRMIGECYAQDAFQSCFPSIGPFLVEGLGQLLPLGMEVFAGQLEPLMQAMQDLVVSLKRMKACGQMLGTSLESNRFITHLEQKRAILMAINTELPDEPLQKIMRQALNTQCESLIAQAKAWHADVAYVEPKLEALLQWLSADDEVSPSDVEANHKQLEAILLRAQSNTVLYFLMNQRIDPLLEVSCENIRRFFIQKICEKIDRHMFTDGEHFRALFQADILKLQTAGNLCLRDITSRVASYEETMDAYVGSFEPPFQEVAQGLGARQKALTERVFATAHQQYDASSEVRGSLKPLLDLLNTMQVADALPDAPRELGAWKNRLLLPTQPELGRMQGLLDNLWRYHQRECLQVLQEEPYSVHFGGPSPQVLIEERIIRSFNENLERIFRRIIAAQIQSLLTPRRKLLFFAGSPITDEQRQTEMAALQNALGNLPLKGGHGQTIRQRLSDYIEQQFSAQIDAEIPRIGS